MRLENRLNVQVRAVIMKIESYNIIVIESGWCWQMFDYSIRGEELCYDTVSIYIEW